MNIENVKFIGSLQIVLTDENGLVKEDVSVKNLVVSTGRAHIVSRMKDTTSAAMTHMAIGNGAVAAAAGDTTLGGELARVALSSTTLVTTTVANDSIQYVATFPAGTGTGSITEAGLLNAASVGTLLCRTVFGVVTKAAGDAMTVTWKVVAA